MEKPIHDFFKKFTFLLWAAGGLLLLTGMWFGYTHLDLGNSTINPKLESKIAALSLNAILADGELTEYAEHSSESLFLEYCAACHGENGVGHKTNDGYFAPVLSDNDWLFEGQIEGIYAAIANGSQGVMPAYRKILAKRDLENITKFVKALSEGHGDREPVGKKIFQNVGCTACHGADAKGSKTIGAVNLTDDIWRFDGSINGIRRTISFGVNSGDPRDRISTMPKFLDAGKLSALEIKKLAIYVYTLSNRHDER